MTPEETKDYEDAMDGMKEAKQKQYHKDVEVIRALKKNLPKDLFQFISRALYESENWGQLKIVDEPEGKYQRETKYFGMWVDQYCEFEDSYYGNCYVELPNRVYLCWHYTM